MKLLIAKYFTVTILILSPLYVQTNCVVEKHSKPSFSEENYFIPPGLDASHGHFKMFILDTTNHTNTIEPLVKKFELHYPDITFNIIWTDDRINAKAHFDKNTSQKIVDVYGGIISHPYVGIEALAIVLAHEVGHHKGGNPTKDGVLSCEGQADYWAVTSCLPFIYDQDEFNNIINNGSHQLNQLFLNGLKKNLSKIDMEKYHKKNKNTQSNCGYPPPECRIQTFMEGLQKEPVKPGCSE